MNYLTADSNESSWREEKYLFTLIELHSLIFLNLQNISAVHTSLFSSEYELCNFDFVISYIILPLWKLFSAFTVIITWMQDYQLKQFRHVFICFFNEYEKNIKQRECMKWAIFRTKWATSILICLFVCLFILQMWNFTVTDA